MLKMIYEKLKVNVSTTTKTCDNIAPCDKVPCDNTVLCDKVLCDRYSVITRCSVIRYSVIRCPVITLYIYYTARIRL